MSLDQRDISILTQVSFKKAASRLDPNADLTDDATANQLKAEVIAFYTVLSEAVLENQKAANVGGATAVQQVINAFPGTTTVASDGTADAPHPADQGGFALEVANPAEQVGPIPDWAVAKAQEQGIRKVWDNRAKAAADPNRNLPHFREFVARGEKARGIWPPKAA